MRFMETDYQAIKKSRAPKHIADAIARTFLPNIIAFFQSDEGRREYKEWENRSRSA